MVFYFSGTGNTRYTAQAIAAVTNNELVSLNQAIKEGGVTSYFCNGETLVFVCPTYAWRIPRVVEKYIKNCTFKNAGKVYFVMTCSTDVGIAKLYINKLCRKKDFKLTGFTYIKGMPSNYIAMFPSEPRAQSEARLDAATPEILRIANLIKNGDSFNRIGYLPGDFTKSALINPLFEKFFIRPKKFYATDACVSCGKCAEVCPLNNVKLSADGLPVWGKQCTHCMSCICACPTEAIEYGNITKGRPRIYNIKDFK